MKAVVLPDKPIRKCVNVQANPPRPPTKALAVNHACAHAFFCGRRVSYAPARCLRRPDMVSESVYKPSAQSLDSRTAAASLHHHLCSGYMSRGFVPHSQEAKEKKGPAGGKKVCCNFDTSLAPSTDSMNVHRANGVHAAMEQQSYPRWGIDSTSQFPASSSYETKCVQDARDKMGHIKPPPPPRRLAYHEEVRSWLSPALLCFFAMHGFQLVIGGALYSHSRFVSSSHRIRRWPAGGDMPASGDRDQPGITGSG